MCKSPIGDYSGRRHPPTRGGRALALFSYTMGQRVSRGRGQSAVRTAAYLARDCYEDQRTGWRHDFSKSPITEASDHIARTGRHAALGSKQEVLFLGLYAPEGAPDWCRGAENIERFWNAAERAERRSDAQIAERIIIALPHEFTVEQARWAVQDHIREFTRTGRVVQVAIYSPEPEHDTRNLHAHLLVSTRGIDGFGLKSHKTQEQQERFLNRSAYIEHLRENWAHVVNRHLKRHGVDATLDHRSYQRQGIDREPEAHMGPGDARRERRGERTAIGDHNRAVRERNARRRRQSFGSHLQSRPEPGAEPKPTPDEDRLQRDAWLDRVPSGWRKLTVEDVARELSPEYARAIAAARRTRALAERWATRRTYWLAQGNVAEFRIKARREEMGILRKALDWAARPARGKPERLPARGRDIRLWQAEQLRGKAAYLAGRAGIKQKAAEELVGYRERVAAAEFEKIQARAEAELQQRQQVAQGAREALEKIGQRHTQRRGQRASL